MVSLASPTTLRGGLLPILFELVQKHREKEHSQAPFY